MISEITKTCLEQVGAVKSSEVKKKRGGQPGNQNGRVHGLYSKSFTPQEQQFLQSALKVPGVDLEVALLCTKFASILANDPNNYEALCNVLSSLDRLLGMTGKSWRIL